MGIARAARSLGTQRSQISHPVHVADHVPALTALQVRRRQPLNVVVAVGLLVRGGEGTMLAHHDLRRHQLGDGGEDVAAQLLFLFSVGPTPAGSLAAGLALSSVRDRVCARDVPVQPRETSQRAHVDLHILWGAKRPTTWVLSQDWHAGRYLATQCVRCMTEPPAWSVQPHGARPAVGAVTIGHRAGLERPSAAAGRPARTEATICMKSRHVSEATRMQHPRAHRAQPWRDPPSPHRTLQRGEWCVSEEHHNVMLTIQRIGRRARTRSLEGCLMCLYRVVASMRRQRLHQLHQRVRCGRNRLDGSVRNEAQNPRGRLANVH